jgi:hypothetical protein
VLDKQKLVEVNPLFEEIARERGFYSENLMKEIARRGTVKGIDEVPADVQRVFATAHDIALGEKYGSPTAALIIDGSSAVFVADDRLQLGACVKALETAQAK